jgi:hypothetical protein
MFLSAKDFFRQSEHVGPIPIEKAALLVGSALLPQFEE